MALIKKVSKIYSSFGFRAQKADVAMSIVYFLGMPIYEEITELEKSDSLQSHKIQEQQSG